MHNVISEMRPHLFVALFIGIISYFLLSLNSNEIINLLIGPLIEKIWNYSLTMAGFCITAYTLLYAVSGKSWFEKIKNTKAFYETVTIFQFTILYHFFLILLTFVCGFINSAGVFKDRSLLHLIIFIAIMLSLFLFGIALLTKVIRLLHILLLTTPEK